ncbi:MAG: enoyl-CoA hydratase [Methylocystis sp.]
MMGISPTSKLRLDLNSGVARVLIDNASKRNAFDFEMWQALPILMEQLDAAQEVRVIVISGAAGLPFCSGADISEFSSVRATSSGGRAYEATNVAAFNAISSASKPTIAAISGFCMGGGMGLAAACDLRMSDESAIFSIPAAKLGLGYPPEAMRYVVTAVGLQKAFELFYTARRLSAQEALSIGFLAQVYPKAQFEPGVMEIAKQMAQNAPLTLRAAKAAIRMVAALPQAATLAECDALAAKCFDSADYAEGRAAFLEKRSANFTGQ